MANILITGANGQLGMEFRNKKFPLLDEIYFTDVLELDITDREKVFDFITRHEIDTIINCAAYTAVDKAETDAAAAVRINRDAVANLAAAAEQNGCLLIHISTDYVFSGSQEHPYAEDDETQPRTEYGRSKLEGEMEIIQSGCIYLIVRTSWLYSAFGHNFVKTILRLSGEKEELNVVNDQWGSPTFASDLADAILAILEVEDLPDYEGIYHYSNEGVCTWFDFAKEIVILSDHRCRINPVTTDQYPTPAPRPAYSVLDKTKIKSTFGLDIPNWQDSLAICMARLKTVEER